MKITKILVAILAICAFAACNPNSGTGTGNGDNTGEWKDSGSPVGEWVLTEWNGSKELPLAVYMSLNEDNTFDLYQHTTNVLWVHYEGTFSLKGTTLTGTYSDGSSWNEYTIKYKDSTETKQIKLTRKGDSEDVAIYTATTIPDAVIDQATEAVVVRSGEIKRFL